MAGCGLGEDDETRRPRIGGLRQALLRAEGFPAGWVAWVMWARRSTGWMQPMVPEHMQADRKQGDDHVAILKR